MVVTGVFLGATDLGGRSLHCLLLVVFESVLVIWGFKREECVVPFSVFMAGLSAVNMVVFDALCQEGVVVQSNRTTSSSGSFSDRKAKLALWFDVCEGKN